MPRIRPLDPKEELLWRSLMRLVITIPRAMSSDLERASGLNGTEYLVLMHLSEAPDLHLRMSDLAERTNLSAGRMTRVVDDLITRGLLAKRPCPDDGRSMLATLTKQGRTTLKSAYSHHLLSVRSSVFDHLSDDDTAQIGTALNRLADAVDAAKPLPSRRSAQR